MIDLDVFFQSQKNQKDLRERGDLGLG